MDLHDAYEQNVVAAKVAYQDKLLELNGIIIGTGSDTSGSYIILNHYYQPTEEELAAQKAIDDWNASQVIQTTASPTVIGPGGTVLTIPPPVVLMNDIPMPNINYSYWPVYAYFSKSSDIIPLIKGDKITVIGKCVDYRASALATIKGVYLRNTTLK
jgi:hypothetical protein